MEMGVEQADGMLKDIDGTNTPSGRPVDVKITSVITMARRKPKFSLKTA